MKKLRALCSTMLRIGFWGFGGGTALIPVIEEELEGTEVQVDSDSYHKNVIVASITPGALPVEIAAGVGRQTAGCGGMIAAALCMALPGALLTLVLVSVLSQVSGVLLTYISYVSIGISMFIVFLLMNYVVTSLMHSCKELPVWGVHVIWVLVFLLTGGKSVYKLLGLEGTPICRLSTVNVLVLAFFLIFYVGGNWTSKRRWPIAIAVSVLYILRISAWSFCMADWMLPVLKGAMIALSAFSMVCYYRDGRQQNETVRLDFKPLGRDVGAWLLFLALMSIPALLVSWDNVWYILKALLSTIISFGGGDAYLAAADGIFVEDALISEHNFYSLLVPVVNALPGSILCKTLSGIGYFVGFARTGSVIGGLLVAVTGLGCSVAASGGVFIIVYHLYSSFERISFFELLRKWIRPIIAGLLMSVSLSMLVQNLSIGAEYQLPGIGCWVLSIGVYGLNVFLFQRFHLKKIFLIALSGGIALAGGLLMAAL